METAHAGPASQPEPGLGAGAFLGQYSCQATALRFQSRPSEDHLPLVQGTAHTIMCPRVCLTGAGLHGKYISQQFVRIFNDLLQLAESSLPVRSLTVLQACRPAFPAYLPGPMRQIPVMLRTVRPLYTDI